jgi:predicted dehydrogenase
MGLPEKKLDVFIIGGGMITGDLILPSFYHLQRIGAVGTISVSALTGSALRSLAENQTVKEAFPNSTFTACPDYKTGDPDLPQPNLYKEVLAKMEPGNLVVVAVPDQLHYGIIKTALEAGQHVITVKPLVLSYQQAKELEVLALSKGLFLGVEYHKRFDDRVLMARQHYRAGRFGDFRLGQARMIEPYYYMNSNFQNWCTCKNSDMFTYVGCHYVDQVHFITGLLPVEVSVHGIKDKYPNGAEGYLWTDGRVIWENGASLSVIDAIGYPNAAPGSNTQGLQMYCKGSEDACMLFHEDQYRGVKYSLDAGAPGVDKVSQEPSPDFFKLVYRGGKHGMEPVGYGYRSIEHLVAGATRVAECGADRSARQREIRMIDDEGILATPANSAYNELVIEAGRLSILNDGHPACIEYGDNPRVYLKEFKK